MSVCELAHGVETLSVCALCVVAVLFGSARSATEAVENSYVESIVKNATHCKVGLKPRSQACLLHLSHSSDRISSKFSLL